MDKYMNILLNICKQLGEIAEQLPRDEEKPFLTITVSRNWAYITNAAFKRCTDYQHLEFRKELEG